MVIVHVSNVVCVVNIHVTPQMALFNFTYVTPALVACSMANTDFRMEAYVFISGIVVCDFTYAISALVGAILIASTQ